MKLFSEKVDSTFTNSSFNVLQVESFSEIFFDVYEIELNKIKYPAEKIGVYNGHPVVSVPVVIGEQECEYPFVLIKGPFEILFNENNKVAGTLSRRVNTVDTTEPELVELFEQTSEEDEVTFDNLIEEESRVKIADQIKTAKQKAAVHIAKLKQAAIEDATIDLKLKKEEFDKVLQIAKDQLVSEFVYVSNTIKKELLDDNDSRYFELESIVGEKIDQIASSLRGVVVEDFNNATEAFDISIKTLISNIHDTQVLPRVESVLNNISSTVDDKVTKLSELVENKLAGKADIALLEDISSSVNAVQVANVELNNALVKGVNKALSRVGTVNTKINEAVVALSDNVNTKIKNATDSIVSYYTEKIQKLEDRTFEINESSRQYFINLVQESRDNLIKEIRDIKQETPVEYIVESKNGRATKSLDSITSELDKKITGKVSEEIARLKQYISMYSSGGGSVAKQFAAGGTMDGNLTVTGAISASSYLGLVIPSPNLSQYLPISGGTITGNLSVVGSVSSSGAMIASNYNPGPNVAAFLQTPTSNNLRAALSDETGTGANVFADNATLSSPTLLGQIFAPNQNVTSSTSVVTKGYLDSTFGEFTRIVATTDDTISHPTTRNPDLVLSANLAANTTYLINVVFYFTGTSTNPFGQLLGTFNLADYTLFHSRTNSYISASVVLATTPFQSFGACLAMTNGRQGVRYEGTITPATSGRLTLGWGPTTAGNTLTRKAGSYIEITRLY